MNLKAELKILTLITAAFLAAFFLPVESKSFQTSVVAMFDLLRWYAREHVVLCLLPAFFIAGVIAVFISQASVIRYFGANTKKWLSYSIASVSGTILAVCSCTILPLFSSIHKKGAGLGPAVTFLYSGPAINILAIILTTRILGIEMGVARIIAAVVFSIIIGLIMSFIYRREESVKKEEQMNINVPAPGRPFWKTAFHFFTLVLILVFANWGKPGEGDTTSVWFYIWNFKWHITILFSIFLVYSLIFILKIKWHWVTVATIATIISGILSVILVESSTLSPIIPMVVAIASLSILLISDKRNEENKDWLLATWDFAKQILPLLAVGVAIAGFLLGSHYNSQSIPGIIPEEWIYSIVGGNSLGSNFFASILGAFMYFATLTEIPIIQGLLASGMGKGPALALLLAGPALSLPNLLVIRSVMGNRKTLIYLSLVVIMSTIAGLIYGNLF